MQAGEPRLAIDYGTVGTVAVLVWPDGRSVPLTFDGGVVLSSAVHATRDGALVMGQAAWEQATADPGRFVPSPVRAGTDTVVVDGAEVEVLDLVAVTLRRVGVEAARVVGAPVGDVRLVVPAGWGPRRRTWMRQAAHRAGLGQPRLVEAPVAASDHVLAMGVQIPVGAFLLVADAGGGFEVTVLRRGPTGFEVLSTLADADAGGNRLDELLLASVQSVLVPGTQAPPGLGDSGWPAVASVRAGKEALSQYPAVTIALPPPATAVVLNSATVDAVAGPVLERAAELTVQAVTAAEITPQQLSGVYVVGAASAMPGVARRLGERLGVTPVVLPDAAMAAVLGAAEAAGAGTQAGAAPAPVPPAVPPVRRVLAMAVPGLASLALFTHFLLSPDYHNGDRVFRGRHYYVVANWGELAMAAVFAVVVCLSAGALLGALLSRSQQSRPNARPAAVRPSTQVGTGILAAAVAGFGIAGLYGVFTALYLGVPMDSPLRWALYPILVPVVLAAVVALIATRWHRSPVQGWDGYLAFPTSAVVCGALGMLLLQYGLSTSADVGFAVAPSRPVGGLLIGVGVACTVVDGWLLRLIIAGPLGVFGAAIVSVRGAGILGGIFAVAVGLWWARRVWDLLHSPVRVPHHAA